MDYMDKRELQDYIKEMKRMGGGLLSRKEEINLAKRIKKGDKEAKNELFFANVRLVVMIAKKFAKNDISLLDLIQEGNIGLLKAIEKYNYKKKYRFSTYAFWWIRHYIQQYLYKNYRDISIPIKKEEIFRKIEKTFSILEKENNRAPTHTEIAEFLDEKEKTIEYIMNIAQPTISLDKKVKDSSSAEFKDLYVADDKWDTERIVNNNLMKEELQSALEKLLDVEKKIILYRYGLINGEKYTLKETSKIFDSSPETIRQIEISALRKIRQDFFYLKDYIE